MKNIVMLILLWTAYMGNVCLAQKVVTKSFAYQKGQEVKLHLKFGKHIQVHAWNKNTVEVKTTYKINNGKLDDAFIINSGHNSNSIWVNTDLDEHKLKDVNCNDCNGINNHFSTFNGNRVCMDITYEVRAPAKAVLHINSISADMDIKGMTGPVYARTISGFVDMNWPASHGAHISMKSISGELYSNLPIQFENKHQTMAPVGYTLRGTLKNGGPDLHLESISGNIYFRKK